MSTDQTLGEMVAADPAVARVFQRYRLDYCCGGKQSLRQACAAQNVDAEVVLREIAGAGAVAKDEARWAERPLDELIAHIIDRYHAPLRVELPRLVELARKVEQVHADNPDRPEGLADLLVDVQSAVESHLAKEEQILFPLVLAGRAQNAYMPVQVLTQEHEDHGQNLRRIRELTRDFDLPGHACASWQELYRSLAELEVDLMDHIHLENNILFPRALAGGA
ncbi:MAG: iron-sulfur cluster repair protein YtfE [Polyangiaceae bacterium]|nr:iron-sulfur cluster repair protein YtfE [Polyangiaceae bacterium]